AAIGHKSFMMMVYIGLIVLGLFMFHLVPKGFVPLQDKQYLVSFAQLPDGATLDRTEVVMKKMSAIITKTPGVEHSVEFPGLSINGFTNSPNSGIIFITLTPASERTANNMSAGAIAGQLNGQFMGIQDAFVLAVPPPPVMGLGM